MDFMRPYPRVTPLLLRREGFRNATVATPSTIVLSPKKEGELPKRVWPVAITAIIGLGLGLVLRFTNGGSPVGWSMLPWMSCSRLLARSMGLTQAAAKLPLGTDRS